MLLSRADGAELTPATFVSAPPPDQAYDAMCKAANLWSAE